MRAVLTLLAGGALAQALPLLLGPWLTRLYSPQAFGQYHLFAAVAANVAVVACARYEFALPMARDDAEAAALRALCLRILAAVTGLTTLGALGWAALADSPWPLWLPVAVAGLGGVSLATLQATRAQRFKRLALARVLQFGGGSVLQVAAGLLQAGVHGLIVGPVLASLAALASLVGLRAQGNAGPSQVSLTPAGLRPDERPSLRTASRLLRRLGLRAQPWTGLGEARPWGCTQGPDVEGGAAGADTGAGPAGRPASDAAQAPAWRAAAARFRDYPLFNTPHAFLGALQDTLAVAIVTAQLGPAAAGAWGLALRYLKAPATLVGGAVSQALYPRLAQAGCSVAGRRLVVQVMALLGLLAAPLVLGLWWWAPDLFAWAFGAPWRAAGELASALALYIGLHFVASPLGVVTLAWDAQPWALRLAVVGQGLFVAALAAGLAWDGLVGAGWAVSLAMAAYFAWYFFRLATWPVQDGAEP